MFENIAEIEKFYKKSICESMRMHCREKLFLTQRTKEGLEEGGASSVPEGSI